MHYGSSYQKTNSNQTIKLVRDSQMELDCHQTKNLRVKLYNGICSKFDVSNKH